jgi:hypothetical protein
MKLALGNPKQKEVLSEMERKRSGDQVDGKLSDEAQKRLF